MTPEEIVEDIILNGFREVMSRTPTPSLEGVLELLLSDYRFCWVHEVDPADTGEMLDVSLTMGVPPSHIQVDSAQPVPTKRRKKAAREEAEAIFKKAGGYRNKVTAQAIVDLAVALAVTPANMSVLQIAKHLHVDRTRNRAEIIAAREEADIQFHSTSRERRHENTEFVNPMPPDMDVDRVSTFRKVTLPDGTTGRQWLISQRKKKKKETPHSVAYAMKEVLSNLQFPVFTPINANEVTTDRSADQRDFLVLGDPHIGLHTWGKETGGRDFDLAIAERLYLSAFDVTMRHPLGRDITIISLGDYTHADFRTPKTEMNGHHLDTDSRWAKIVEKATMLMVSAVRTGLERYQNVHLIMQPGNHDYHTSMMIGMALDLYFKDEPRVTVDRTIGDLRHVEFGNNLIVCTHGQYIRGNNLVDAVAADLAPAWGRTTERHIFSGHIHNYTAKTHSGIEHETFPTLTPPDTYAATRLYRSPQRTYRMTFDKEFGRIRYDIFSDKRVEAESGRLIWES